MKNILILIFLICSISVHAAYHTLKATGGTFATTTEANAHIFVPDDTLAVYCTETFYGTLAINQSGTAGHPIVITKYGTGANPVITGFTTISGWTDEGGGIYSKVITSESQTNMVTIDGVQYGVGRYPNSTYLTYESYSTDVSITDNQLTGTPDWTGAQLIKRPNDWDLEKCLITNHVTGTLTYTNSLSNYTGVAGNGYFIQNDLRTLDAYGEWYHDYSGTGKFYMYFGAIDPTTKIVKVATKNYGIDIQGKTYIVVDGIAVTGVIKNGLTTSSASANLTVKNCVISFTGTNGIYANSIGALIDNNSISYCNSSAVRGGSNDLTVTNNTITNIGLIKGASEAYYNAIMLSVTTGHLIQYNSIVNSGSNGIMVTGANITISNNFIDHSNIILNDGGGIYTSGPLNSGTTISNNIVLNSVGNYDGGNTALSISEGIYLDELSTLVTVSGNTVGYCGYSGIKLHKANTCTVQNNICYGNIQAGMLLLGSSGAAYLFDNIISNNTLVAKTGQYTILYNDSQQATVTAGTFNSNIYAKPIINSSAVRTNTLGAAWSTRTLSEWQTFSGQDANSTGPPVSISSDNDIFFDYNATATARPATLPYPCVDLTGTKKTGWVTVPAYSSVLLLKDPNPATPPPTGSKYQKSGSKFIINPGNGKLQMK